MNLPQRCSGSVSDEQLPCCLVLFVSLFPENVFACFCILLNWQATQNVEAGLDWSSRTSSNFHAFRLINGSRGRKLHLGPCA